MSGYNSKKRRIPSVRSGGNSTPSAGTGRGVLPGSGSNNSVPTLGTRQPNINPSTGKPMNNPGFEELLGQFGGTSDLANSLLQLGVGDPSHFQLSGDDATTWNQQLLTILIQYLLTQEQRNYNEQLLNEGRLYDNPQNQLARLMGAGISRDAALQLLSGSGGSGSGGSLPYGDAAAAPSMSDFAAMKDAHTNAMLGTWNASMNTINSIMSMVDIGFSVPQSIEQVESMRMQNYLSREQQDAYNAVSQAFSVVNSAGVPNSDEVFGSIDSTCNTIKKLADDGYEPAKNFVSAGGLATLRRTAPYSSPFLSKLYRSERDAKDYDRSYSATLGNLFAQKELAHMQADNLAAGIKVMEEQIEVLRTQEAYNNAAAALQTASAKLAEKQGLKVEAETFYTKQLTKQLQLSNALEESFQTTTYNGKSGLQLFTDNRLNELNKSVQLLSTLNDKKSWQKEADALLANYDNAIAVYTLGTLYANGEIGAINQSTEDIKDLLYFCRASQDCGLFDYTQQIIDAESSGYVSSSHFSTNLEIESAADVLDIVGNKKNRQPKKRK